MSWMFTSRFREVKDGFSLRPGLKAQLFMTERFKFNINFFYFIKPATNVPPHSLPLEEVIGIGVLLVVFIAKSFPIITARFVVSLAWTASQSLSGTAMNFAAWSVVLFKTALPFMLTPYKMCFTVSWPRIEITLWSMAKNNNKGL